MYFSIFKKQKAYDDHRKGESPNTQVFQSAPKRRFGTSGSWWRSVGCSYQSAGRNSCPGRLSHRRWNGTDYSQSGDRRGYRKSGQERWLTW
ncbi:hypothetical protein [Peijinzhouia sedimentorum]